MKVIRKVVAGVVSALALTGTTLGGIALGRGMTPGETGPQGEVGPQGPQGQQGNTGAAGKSAYELYVASVPSGQTPMTQAQWAESLVGEDGLSAYQIAKNNGFNGDIAAWLESLVGADGASAYDIYKQFHTDYTGTQEDFAHIFEELVQKYENKGNITFNEWVGNVKNNDFAPFQTALNYSDAIPFGNFDANACRVYYSYPFNTKFVIESKYILDNKYEDIVSLEGKTEAYISRINDCLAIDMDCSVIGNNENGEQYAIIKDSITLMPIGSEFKLIYECQCDNAAEPYCYYMPIKGLVDYQDIAAYLLRALMLSATSYQFERAGGNVVDLEAVGKVMPIEDYMDAVTNSKCNYDEATGTYSLTKGDEFGYEYKMSNKNDTRYISETKSFIAHYNYPSIPSTGRLEGSTQIILENSEEHQFPELTNEYIETEYGCFPYAFGGATFHSIGSVLNTILVDTNFETVFGLNYNNYYGYKDFPIVVNAEIVNSDYTFTVGEQFDTSNMEAYAFYSNGKVREMTVSINDDIYADCYVETEYLPLNGSNQLTTAGSYQLPVYFSTLGFGSEYEKYITINVKEAPVPPSPKVAASLTVTGLIYNFKVGEDYTDDGINVVVNYDDGTTREADPLGPSDHSGYLVNYEAAHISGGKFTESGMFPMKITCEGLSYEYFIYVAPAASSSDPV